MSIDNRPDPFVKDEKVSVLRATLWVVLITSTMANWVTSAHNAPLSLQLIIGAVSAAALLGLVANRLRSR